MKNVSMMRIGAAATVLALGSLAACSGGGSGSDGDGVVIGLLQPMTGPLASYGEESTAGFNWVVDAYNKEGGLKDQGGATIKVVVADSAGDPTKASTEARRLVSREKVDAVAGILSTPESAASMPFLEKSKVPSLGILSAYPSSSQYTYTLGQSSRGYASSMVDFVKYLNEQGANLKTAGLASSNYELGQQVDKALGPLFQDAGLSVVEKTPLDITSDDYNASITKQNNKKPDVVAGAMTLPNGLSVFKARMATDANSLWIGTAQVPNAEVFASLGDSPERAAMAQRTFQITNYSPDAQQVGLQALVKALKASKPNQVITQNFVQGAQAAWVLIDSLERAGSADADKLSKAMGKTNLAANSERMVLARAGAIAFGEDHFMTDLRGVVIQLAADGSQHVVWPESVASSKVKLP